MIEIKLTTRDKLIYRFGSKTILNASGAAAVCRKLLPRRPKGLINHSSSGTIEA